jgi:protein tyrosine phosphatase (PTP) superfamily phosphohydrolase (DUF442 family)
MIMKQQIASRLLVAAIVSIVCSGGCARGPGAAADVAKKAQREETAAAAPIKQQDQPGLHNLVQVVDRSLYSGSEPHGEEGFASLARLGIKTIVSVDGARPNLELAHQHGMKYVHVPIGYDGITPSAGKTLARAARQCEGPIYVHCHHGQHRGPAAAAVMCVAAGAIASDQARTILEVAGTGQQYPGLWRDVAGYTPPSDETELPPLVEEAQVESFAAAMAKIDRNFDNLKLCQQAAWSVPPDHPDLVALQESVILREGLREAQRNLASDRHKEFRGLLAESEALSQQLEESIRRRDHAQADAKFALLEAACKHCHNKHRN